MGSAQAAGARGARSSMPGRGWTLAALYPVLVVLLALFVAYPLLDLLLRSVRIGDTLSLAPLFKLLGTPAEHKRHVIFESAGHAPPRIELIGEVLDWLDRYLGPVGRVN